jgi:hypothetical protein
VPSNGVVEHHRFDANSDPGPTFYFDADPDPNHAASLTDVGN